MILDKFNEFLSNVAIPTAAGTSIVGDVIDLGTVQRDVGNGQPIYWYAVVNTTGTGGTSLQLNLVSGPTAALAAPTVHATTGTVVTANLGAGKFLVIVALPTEGPLYQRYLGIQAVAAGTFTGGTISSGITLDTHGWKAYKQAIQ